MSAGLDQIAAKTYTSDFDFQNDLNQLFNRLGDAHTLYYHPSPYRSFYYWFPFFFTSQLVNNQQVIVTGSETALGGTLLYSEVAGVNVANYVGKVITSINGQSPINFIQAIADKAGISRSAGEM